MVSLDSIRTPILADLEAFDEFVRGQFASDGRLLSEMLTHVLSSRGKGVRPMIVMLTSMLTSPMVSLSPRRRISQGAMASISSKPVPSKTYTIV